MAEQEGLKLVHYHDTTVELDGHTFQNCTFDRCTLVYRGNDLPNLTNNSLNECLFRFDDAAIRTIVFLQQLYTGGMEKIVEDFIRLIKSGAPPGTPSPH